MKYDFEKTTKNNIPSSAICQEKKECRPDERRTFVLIFGPFVPVVPKVLDTVSGG